MKTRITLLLVLLIPLAGMAQGHKHNYREALRAKKVAYITDHLDLSVKDAQQFWPVYNEYEKKMEHLIDQERDLKRETRHLPEDIDTKTLEENVDSLIELDVKKAELRKTYYAKFKMVLSIEKVARLYHTEHEFRRHLLKEYRRCGPNGKGNSSGPHGF